MHNDDDDNGGGGGVGCGAIIIFTIIM